VTLWPLSWSQAAPRLYTV